MCVCIYKIYMQLSELGKLISLLKLWGYLEEMSSYWTKLHNKQYLAVK